MIKKGTSNVIQPKVRKGDELEGDELEGDELRFLYRRNLVFWT